MKKLGTVVHADTLNADYFKITGIITSYAETYSTNSKEFEDMVSITIPPGQWLLLASWAAGKSPLADRAYYRLYDVTAGEKLLDEIVEDPETAEADMHNPLSFVFEYDNKGSATIALQARTDAALATIYASRIELIAIPLDLPASEAVIEKLSAVTVEGFVEAVAMRDLTLSTALQSTMPYTTVGEKAVEIPGVELTLDRGIWIVVLWALISGSSSNEPALLSIFQDGTQLGDERAKGNYLSSAMIGRLVTVSGSSSTIKGYIRAAGSGEATVTWGRLIAWRVD